MALPTIGTAWSGNTAFMNDKNSYLVNFTLVRVYEHNEDSMYVGHTWAEPDIKHLRQQMRHVVVDRQAARKKGRRARRDIVVAFDQEVVAEKILNEILRIERSMSRQD